MYRCLLPQHTGMDSHREGVCSHYSGLPGARPAVSNECKIQLTVNKRYKCSFGSCLKIAK
uniref:Uncharacterized protein n=1 Tax=Kalanchoe fedtschenkoi TaxID=63787 RepID=A0A7N1A855_KALFE